MCLNRTSEWKVMTILISRELPLFNFQRIVILCAWIGHPSENLGPFEFLESIRCSITNSWYTMQLNRTSVWKVMIILISRDLPLFNFEHLDIWCAWIGPPCEKLWPFKFLESIRSSITNVSIYYAPESEIRVKCYDQFNFSRASVVQFRASQYMMCLNRTSAWKVMTILISRYLLLFNFERLDMWCFWIATRCEKLGAFEFLESFCCSISSVSICDVPESNIRVKSYGNFNFSRASVVQFRASWYMMRLNRTSVWKVMTIWISWDLSLFNFERLHTWCAWIRHPSEKLWQF